VTRSPGGDLAWRQRCSPPIALRKCGTGRICLAAYVTSATGRCWSGGCVRRQGSGRATRRRRSSSFVLLAHIMLPFQTFCCNREVVERRVYTVTGQRPGDEEVEQLIETGESETIFQKAILEQGRGQVCI